MSPFGEDLLFGIVFVGLSQAACAVALAAPICFISALCRSVDYDRFVRRYALFNLFLFGWSIVGNYVWLRLTWGGLFVLDDMPVWLPFVPFGRAVLNFATGGPDSWHPIGDTTMADLRVYWVATAMPVWLVTILSMRVYLRTHLASPSARVS